MTTLDDWNDHVTLRPELIDQRGQIIDLRMSLFDVVYRTADVPYQQVSYFGQITQPTPGLRRFMGQVAARLGTSSAAAQAQPGLYHLDQGMGGGKSHALVGLYHMVAEPVPFFATDIGAEVRDEATDIADAAPDLSNALSVVLCADKMTPGKPSPEFGPAKTLHERFLWSLFEGDAATYDSFRDGGYDKGAIRRALEHVNRPVLILVDELTDYGLMLAQEGGMAGEQAFLNALFDAVDDLPQVVAVIVMIRSELDEQGYPKETEDFRDYLAGRLERNGTTVTVTDAQDFASIIRRRLFDMTDTAQAVKSTSAAWRRMADNTWTENVFDRLPAGRGIEAFESRLARTYPFHPDLIDLVESEWSRHTGFQRVRSTVTIFAATAYYWQIQHEKEGWSPPLIGPGDIPLSSGALEAVLSSGLLHGNDRVIRNLRQVAASDIISKDGATGQATEIDEELGADASWYPAYPNPAQRMATALYLYSLVPRTQTRKGATKAELLSSAVVPDGSFSYQDADTVFGRLTDDEDGLGSLEVFQGTGGNTPTRYVISTEMTLRMFYRRARGRITVDGRDEYLWERTKHLARKGGGFDEAIFIERPADSGTPLGDLFSEIDQSRSNRIVILDPRRWTLLNGRDSATREDISQLLGVGERGLHMIWAASCVVVCVNTQRREQSRKRASDALAWRFTCDELDGTEEALHSEAIREHGAANAKLDNDILRAFQHYSYLYRRSDDLIDVAWKRFEDDHKSSLRGNLLWDTLVDESRAVHSGTLAGSYLKNLVEKTGRTVTLGEVTDWFWSNPSFPLVARLDDVRSAVFENIRQVDGWDIVSSSDEILSYDRPDQIPIISKDLYVVGKQPVAPKDEGTEGTPESDPTTEHPTPTVYKRYRLVVPSRSVAKDEDRQKVYAYLMELARIVDPADLSPADVQLIELDVTLTAAEDSLTTLRDPLGQVDGRWQETEDLI